MEVLPWKKMIICIQLLGWAFVGVPTLKMIILFLLRLQERTDFQKLGVKWEVPTSLSREELTDLNIWGTGKTTKQSTRKVLNVSSTTAPYYPLALSLIIILIIKNKPVVFKILFICWKSPKLTTSESQRNVAQ